MNTKLASRGMMSKLQRTLLAVLVVMILFGSLPVGKAHAWRSVYTLPTNVTLSPINVLAGSNAGQIAIWVNGRGPVMPSNNIQWGNYKIVYRYQLEQWLTQSNGSTAWSLITTQVNPDIPVSMGTGTTVFLNDVNFWITKNATGIFRVTYKIWWVNSSGATFAYAEIVPTLANDFSCQPYLLWGIPCQTGSGWFKIGY